ncbi:FAM49A-like isoform X2 [Achlya hypogyna]|uniref:FAM49A-like isoform X2 n=1 Tax=Achlya hypogyna TaxID=1202772 RepID=A0A1V9ZMA0_ACHHY|nr:FAM49A-like isoform X2 [Achlya hypogyna]
MQVDHLGVCKSLMAPGTTDLAPLVANVAYLYEVYVAAQEQCIDDHPELIRRVADICISALLFDSLKATQPGVQNDVSFYRRYLIPSTDNQVTSIKESQANALSLFLAEHMPIVKGLARAVAAVCHQSEQGLSPSWPMSPMLRVQLYIPARATAPTILRAMTVPPLSPAEELYCMRAMAASILVLDHALPKGALRARSAININKCLRVLAEGQKSLPACTQLLGAIKYASRHGNDAATPRQIRALLG